MHFVIAESAGDSLLAFEQHLSTADSAPQRSEAPNSIAGKAVENRGTTAAITKAANKTSTKRANQEAIAKDCPCSGSAARGTRIVDIGLRTRSPTTLLRTRVRPDKQRSWPSPMVAATINALTVETRTEGRTPIASRGPVLAELRAHGRRTA
jgi:hypothetical protein